MCKEYFIGLFDTHFMEISLIWPMHFLCLFYLWHFQGELFEGGGQNIGSEWVPCDTPEFVWSYGPP